MMATSLTEVLVVLGLGAALVTSGIFACSQGKALAEQKGRAQMTAYTRLLQTLEDGP
jgi:hypothetical protein